MNKPELGQPLTLLELISTANFLMNRKFKVVWVATSSSRYFPPDEAFMVVRFFVEDIFCRAFILTREMLREVFVAYESGQLDETAFCFETDSTTIKLVRLV